MIIKLLANPAFKKIIKNSDDDYILDLYNIIKETEQEHILYKKIVGLDKKELVLKELDEDYIPKKYIYLDKYIDELESIDKIKVEKKVHKMYGFYKEYLDQFLKTMFDEWYNENMVKIVYYLMSKYNESCENEKDYEILFIEEDDELKKNNLKYVGIIFKTIKDGFFSSKKLSITIIVDYYTGVTYENNRK